MECDGVLTSGEPANAEQQLTDLEYLYSEEYSEEMEQQLIPLSDFTALSVEYYKPRFDTRG